MDTQSEQIAPTVGIGATIQIGSDRYAYTVVEISPSGKTLTLQRDTNIGSLFISNKDGEIEKVRLSKVYGKYMLKGRYFVTIGKRSFSMDQGF
jgi:hypothetical protein